MQEEVLDSETLKKLEDSIFRYGTIGGALDKSRYSEQEIIEAYNKLNCTTITLEEYKRILFTPFYSARLISSPIDLGAFSAFVINNTVMLENITKKFVNSQKHIVELMKKDQGVNCFIEFKQLRGIVNLASVDDNGNTFGIIRILRHPRLLGDGFSAWRGEIGTNRMLIFLRLVYCYVVLNPEIFGINNLYHIRPISTNEEALTKFDDSMYDDETKIFINRISCTKTYITEREDNILRRKFPVSVTGKYLIRCHERSEILKRFKTFEEIRETARKLLKGKV